MDQTKHMLLYDTNTLTSREWSVIELVCEGLHNRDISQHLGLEERSVKQLLRTVYHKMGTDRLNLALWYLRQQYERTVHN